MKHKLGSYAMAALFASGQAQGFRSNALAGQVVEGANSAMCKARELRMLKRLTASSL